MGNDLTAVPSGIALRPVRPSDREFLLQLYANTRADELSVVPWSEADKTSFVAMQFSAQDSYYRHSYPGGRFLLVTREGVPIGRLYVAELDDEIRLIDVALVPEHRGAGVGSALLAAVLSEADAAGLPVRLHVEPWNPARRLYERLGFRTLQAGDVYDLMERAPASASATAHIS